MIGYLSATAGLIVHQVAYLSWVTPLEPFGIAVTGFYGPDTIHFVWYYCRDISLIWHTGILHVPGTVAYFIVHCIQTVIPQLTFIS